MSKKCKGECGKIKEITEFGKDKYRKDGYRSKCKKCKNKNVSKCKNEKCNKIPNYNYESENVGIYCNKHKLENMIDVKNKKCIYKDCNTISNYNYKNEKYGIYCSKHKLKRMVDVFNKMCIECGFEYGLKKINYYCSICYRFNFPNSDYSKNYKKKTQDFIDEIFKNNFKEYYNWVSFDKKIEGGCSRRRPDYLKDLKTHSLILEIDEKQHKGYNKQCEINRMNEIYQDLGYRPIIFIRFNPDSYIDENGNKIESIFKLSPNIGKLSIDKNECIKRLKIVCENIEKYSKVDNIDYNNHCKEVKLFFDKE
jgi:hypothetical protein